MSLSCHHPAAQALAGSGAFFAFGLAGGLHCLGMCGPLACLFSRAEEKPLLRLGLYQTGRLAAYAGLGALAAALGNRLVPLLSWPLLACLAVLPLLAWAFWPREALPAFLGRWHAAAARALGSWPAGLRALAFGLLTPALPCGLLYAAAAAAASAPGWELGALWMVAFAAGTLPLLALGQLGWSWAAGRLSPGRAALLRRGAAAVAAATLILLACLA